MVDDYMHAFEVQVNGYRISGTFNDFFSLRFFFIARTFNNFNKFGWIVLKWVETLTKFVKIIMIYDFQNLVKGTQGSRRDNTLQL